MKRVALLVALVALLPGCEDSAEPFVPPSFDRADQVAFACLDVLGGEGLPVSECEAEDAASELHLLALVTQSQRGELAIVDLDAETLVDVDPQVPGFTFHPVGELPTGVAVSPDGTRAYVACSGSHNLAVFDVGSITGPAGRLDPIDLGEHAPFDVLATEGRVFVTAPDEGLLLFVDPETGDVGELVLGTAGDGPGGGDGDAGPEDAGAGDGGAGDAGADAGADAGQEPPDEGASRPWRMAFDSAENVLLVANAGRTEISVVDVEGPTETSLLDVGATTTSVAVSPVRTEGDGQRWLYAVERDQGGVRVAEIPSGELVDVNHGTTESGETYDDPLIPGPAIRVPGLARAVEFFSRGSEGDPAPEILDGLFAAILSSDGLLYVVDVEDDDRPEREADLDEVGYVFLPHHLRSLRRFTEAGLPQVLGNPTVEVASTQAICSVDYGFLAHFDATGAPPCDDAGAGIVVQTEYPWQSTDQTWTVIYEGTIPGTIRPRANLESDREVLDRAADYCSLGVQPGDRFVLTTTPSPARADVECGQEDADPPSWIIAEVFRDRLVLEEPFGLDLEDCGLDAFVDYRVRVEDSWTVVGSATGFLHNVVEDETGHCVPRDESHPDFDARNVARALECDAGPDVDACRFQNPFLTFTIVRGAVDGNTQRTEVDTVWTFSTTNALDPLAIAVGALPSSVHYLPRRDSLVVVDPVEAGLVEVSVGNLARERSYR